MAESKLPLRMEYPTPSVATGPMFDYLTRLAMSINAVPKHSYTSYNGGPNSNFSGQPGETCTNIVSSGQTARFFVKELGSGNTGWVSVVTNSGSGSFGILATGQATLSGGVVLVSTAVVTSSNSVFITDAGGGIVANIGSLYVNGVTSGVSFAISSSNALDSSKVNWLIIGPR